MTTVSDSPTHGSPALLTKDERAELESYRLTVKLDESLPNELWHQFAAKCHAAQMDVYADAFQAVDNIIAEREQLRQHIAALEQRVGVYERALEYLSIRRDQNHNCDDYARGYGQAKADVATFAKAALPKEPR